MCCIWNPYLFITQGSHRVWKTWKNKIFISGPKRVSRAKIIHVSLWPNIPGPWFNIKISSYQYRKSHCGEKTVVRSSYLHKGISYTGKMTSLYWIRALIFTQITPIITILCQILGSLNWVMVGSMSCLSRVCCWAITSTSDDLLSLEPNLHWNLNQNMENYAQGNAFENGICKMA